MCPGTARYARHSPSVLRASHLLLVFDLASFERKAYIRGEQAVLIRKIEKSWKKSRKKKLYFPDRSLPSLFPPS